MSLHTRTHTHIHTSKLKGGGRGISIDMEKENKRKINESIGFSNTNFFPIKNRKKKSENRLYTLATLSICFFFTFLSTISFLEINFFSNPFAFFFSFFPHFVVKYISMNSFTRLNICIHVTTSQATTQKGGKFNSSFSSFLNNN